MSNNIKIAQDSVLFFDMDGTLIDTDYSNYLAYKEAIRSVTGLEHDLIFSKDKRFNRNSLKIAIPDLSNDQHERIIQEKEKCYKYFLNQTKLNNSVADIFLKYAKTNRTVLVTKCREERALQTLEYHGLINNFSHTFFRKFGDKGEKINKYQNAISELSILPNLIVAFENEELEIQDAQRAGILFINPSIL